MENYKLIGSTLAVNLPEGATDIEVIKDLWYYDSYEALSNWVVLPEGSWSILGRPSELTDEQKELCVEKVMNGQHYLNYKATSVVERWAKDLESSFTSFLEAHGLDENHILLTKNK